MPMLTSTDRSEMDLRLLSRIAEGDSSAIGELYDHYSSLLYPIMLHIIGDSEQAGRALRKLFVDLWESQITYDPAFGSPAVWMSRMARDRAVMHRRQSSQSTVPPTFPPALAMFPGLTEQQRRLVASSYYGGSTVPELAVQFSLDETLVRKELRAAMSLLRERMRQGVDPIS